MRKLLLILFCLLPTLAWADWKSVVVTSSATAVSSPATLLGFYVTGGSADSEEIVFRDGINGAHRLTMYAPTSGSVFIPTNDDQGGMDFSNVIYIDLSDAGSVTVFYK